MIRHRTGCWLVYAGLISATAFAAFGRTPRREPPRPDLFTFRNGRGMAVERVHLNQPMGIHVLEQSGDRLLLSDGTILSRHTGRWVHEARLAGPLAAGTLAAQGPDPSEASPEYVLAGENRWVGPVFDPTGTAWVLMESIDGFDLAFSSGPSSPWQFIPVPDFPTEGRFYNFTVDSQGVVTFVDRHLRSADGLYDLNAIRYLPGEGWGEVEQPESTPQFFQSIRITTDQDDNVIVFYDREGANSESEAWSVVYEAAAGQWGAPQRIGPSAIFPGAPRLLRTPSGDAVHAVYFDPYARPGPPAKGVFAQSWDSATMTWSQPQFLRFSNWAAWSSLSALAELPAGVDAAGNLYLAWGICLPRGWCSAVGSTYANGSWQPSHRLLEWTQAFGISLSEPSGGHASSAGTYVGVTLGYGPLDEVRLFAFRHDPIGGWTRGETPYRYDGSSSTRVRVTTYQGTKAVASVSDPVRGQLVGVYHDGAAWSNQTPAIDPLAGTVTHELNSAGPHPLAIWSRGIEGRQGILARWLD